MSMLDFHPPSWARHASITLGAFVLLGPLLASASCATPDDSVVVGGYPPSSPPSFGAPDASAPDAAAPRDVLLCDTTECPAGRATCLGARFPCAVDLMTDDFNCGSCGHACGTGTDCVDGKCKLVCAAYGADCNGVLDDGCEAGLLSDMFNCGACGNRCQVRCYYGHCDCSDLGPNATLCGTECVADLKYDARHCGACGNACPQGSFPPAWNAQIGCLNATCTRTCKPGFGDCNGDLSRDDGDGCETPGLLDDPKNCGACGVECATGEVCREGQCFGCNPGEALCSGRTGSAFGCYILTTDPQNCGACGRVCPTSDANQHGVAVCVEGTCDFGCETGYADCDGDRSTGCEVNIRIDPDHCGGCGRRCPLAGQACIEGECVQAPCPTEPTQ